MSETSSPELPREEIKSESYKPPDTFTKRINPLGMPEVNYNELPGSFEIGEELTDAAVLLRHRTEIEKTEVGGVLTKDQEGRLGFMVAGEKGDTFALSMVEITDKNLRWFTEGQIKASQDGKPTNDVVFVPKRIADGNHQYFKSLVDMGTEVVLDRVPAGKLHSHPSGNLPSTGDFSQTVSKSSLESSSRIPEIIVTSEYAYLLFPTKQTLDLTSENLVQEKEKWEDEEDKTVSRLTEIDRANGIKTPNLNSHVNAFRYNFLRSHCLEHNVGFYVLKNGEKTAQRVF